jgi:hypothetical protein
MVEWLKDNSILYQMWLGNATASDIFTAPKQYGVESYGVDEHGVSYVEPASARPGLSNVDPVKREAQSGAGLGIATSILIGAGVLYAVLGRGK